MKVKIFGRDSFDSRWIETRRGWLNHRCLCDGYVIVHDYWYLKGYQYAATYNSNEIDRIEVLDWCQEKAQNEHILHPYGAVLFKDNAKAVEFAMRWS